MHKYIGTKYIGIYLIVTSKIFAGNSRTAAAEDLTAKSNTGHTKKRFHIYNPVTF